MFQDNTLYKLTYLLTYLSPLYRIIACFSSAWVISISRLSRTNVPLIILTVLAKLLYANPVWLGFGSAADVNKLNKFVNKCKKLYNCKQIDSGITELTLNLLTSLNHPNHITSYRAVTISY